MYACVHTFNGVSFRDTPTPRLCRGPWAAKVLTTATRHSATVGKVDDPIRLAALLDADGWGAVTSGKSMEDWITEGLYDRIPRAKMFEGTA